MIWLFWPSNQKKGCFGWKNTGWPLKDKCFMDFERQLQKFLDLFEPYAKKYFEGRQKSVLNYPKLIAQFYKDLADFTAGGKKLRGFLVYLGYSIGAKEHLRGGKGNLLKILPVALAIELVHSFLLIHDDVIDQSEMRRGKQTIHKRYEKIAPPSLKDSEG